MCSPLLGPPVLQEAVNPSKNLLLGLAEDGHSTFCTLPSNELPDRIQPTLINSMVTSGILFHAALGALLGSTADYSTQYWNVRKESSIWGREQDGDFRWTTKPLKLGFCNRLFKEWSKEKWAEEFIDRVHCLGCSDGPGWSCATGLHKPRLWQQTCYCCCGSCLMPNSVC